MQWVICGAGCDPPLGPRLTHLDSCRLRQGAPGPVAGEGRADRRPHAPLLRLLPQPSQGVLPARQVRLGLSFLPWICPPPRPSDVTPTLLVARPSPGVLTTLTTQAGSGGDVRLQGRRGLSGWGCLGHDANSHEWTRSWL